MKKIHVADILQDRQREKSRTHNNTQTIKFYAPIAVTQPAGQNRGRPVPSPKSVTSAKCASYDD